MKKDIAFEGNIARCGRPQHQGKVMVDDPIAQAIWEAFLKGAVFGAVVMSMAAILIVAVV